MKDKQTKQLYEFDGFRLDTKKRRLMRGENLISLTPKEYDILFLLIENAGRVVEKDELFEAVWKDTFVEEGTLTRNISWLRKKLAAYVGHDAKIIETLPKRGYRFLPEVRANGEDIFVIEESTVQQFEIEEIIEFEPSFNENESAIVEIQNPTHRSITHQALPASRKRISPNLIFLATLFLIAGAILIFLNYFVRNQPNVVMASKIAPFSGLPGRENSPSFSPEGDKLVFSWDGGVENGNFDIYVKLIDAGEPMRLTNSENDEINPVFSPNGKSIAFVRAFGDHNEIILISALGGSERKIYEQASYASLSFSPDGQLLAQANLDLSNNDAGIYTTNLQTGERKRLTTPQAPSVDHTPRFSPDGKSLAFIRYFNSFRREIFIVSALGGEPQQITSDNVRIYGLAWSSDNEKIFFTSFREANQVNLWQISVNGGEPQLIPTGGRDLQSVAISPNNRTIAYVEDVADENIWQIEPNGLPQLLIRSTRADHSQQFSPDGSQIVFASDRTGNYEIWIANSDGKNQRQLTDSVGSAGSPRFSPDGKFVVFDAQMAQGSEIFVIPTNGGVARRLTEGAKNNSLPAWSVDGQFIFFISNRAGNDQIWKMPVAGGEAMQITRQGAFEMFAAPDGNKIIYSKGVGKIGLWTINIDGTNEEAIPELSGIGSWRSWSVSSSGIYFTAFSTQTSHQIKFYDFKTRETRQITAVNKPPLAYYQNLCVSADGKKILYSQEDQTSASIMLAELAK